MSDKKVTKQTVKIKESHLVDLIDDIVNEAVAVKKQEWISEQKTLETNKTTLLEGKIQELEARFNKLIKSK